jgi:uncharacterized membrane protein
MAFAEAAKVNPVSIPVAADIVWGFCVSLPYVTVLSLLCQENSDCNLLILLIFG